MATLIPFSAVKPAPDKAPFVVTRSYDSYSEEDLESTLRQNPYSFLHIIHQSTFHKEKPLKDRFVFIKEKFDAFHRQQILLEEASPSFYIYELQQRNFTFLGLICGTSMDEYNRGLIKKHEDTLAYRENLFMEYLDVVGFNAEPVLLTYPGQGDLNALLEKKIALKPDLDFTTEPDGDRHKLWTVSALEEIENIQRVFEQVPHLYIADGHHRMASSSLLAKQRAQNNPAHTGNESYNFCLSYLIPESQLKIFPYNRLVQDLDGQHPEDFLKALATSFDIENQGTFLYQPSQKGNFSLYLAGNFYRLTFKEKKAVEDSLSLLDAQILYREILHPLLGIDDLRNNRRLAYIYGKDNLLKIKEKVDSGKFVAGFGLYPVQVNELKNIADDGLSMPPKSTYIVPKLRTGLTVYPF